MADETETAEVTEEEQQSLPMDAAAMADVAAKAAAAETRAQAAENRVTAIEQQQRDAAAQAEAAQNAPQKLTPELIQNAVDEMKITAAQGAQMLAEQSVKEAESAIEERITGKLKAEAQQKHISQEKDSYYELRKSLSNVQSEDFKLAQTEYAHLTEDLGMPKTEATEVAAMRNVFGTVENLRASQPKDRQGFSETGGGSVSPSETTSTDGWPPEIADKPNFIHHYERMISRGAYTGKDDPQILKEMKHIGTLQ